MRRSVGLLLGALVFMVLIDNGAYSYQPETHGELSRAAYLSANVDDKLQQLLGVMGSGKLYRRSFLSGESMTPINWLREGSRDEDALLRPFNHFYDPIYHRGLTYEGSLLGEKAYEWALEDLEEINGQAYSYRHAKETYLRALTRENASDREHWLATTFYTLGRVLHVLQDIASPAHVRNARHVGRDGLIDLGPKSVVELHLDTIRGELSYNGFSVPKTAFTRLRDLWVETDAAGRPLTGPSAKGLSQVINQHFVSEGTNFTAFQNGNHATEYALPTLDTSQCTDEVVDTTNADRERIQGPVTFCANSFVDPITGTLETNPRMTTFSLFGRDLVQKGIALKGTFALNALNAESIGRLTIPRAVGYSAALLDYFFRGKLDVQRAPHPETQQPSLRVINRSTEGLGVGGKFSVYRDDDNGQRSLLAGATKELAEFIPPDNADTPIYLPLPTPVPTGPLTVIYSGPLGLEENAVIGKVVSGKLHVEQVYRDWGTGRWALHTSGGIYLLPVEEVAGLSAPLDSLTWGERDNQLVGLTSPYGSDPYQVVLYELARPVGDHSVPHREPSGEGGDPTAEVRVIRQVQLLPTMARIPLETRLNFHGSYSVAQYAIQYEVKTDCQYVENKQSYECNRTVGGDSLYGPIIYGTHAVEVSALMHFASEKWLYTIPWPPYYGWEVLSVQADRTGKLVAIVRIVSTYIPQEEGYRDAYPLQFGEGCALVPMEHPDMVGNISIDPPVWILALVDLDAGQLIAKTSTDEITTGAQGRVVTPIMTPVCRYDLTTFTNGPRDGDKSEAWRPGGLEGGGGPSEETIIALRASELNYYRKVRADGLFRSNFNTVGLGAIESGGWGESSWPMYYSYRTDEITGRSVGVLFAAPPSPIVIGPAEEAHWLRWWGPFPGKLRFAARAIQSDGEKYRTWIVDWDLASDEARPVFTDLAPRVWEPMTANASGLIAVRSDMWPTGDWKWVSWSGATLDLPGMPFDDAWKYVALDPDYFYGLYTGKFHEVAPGLPVQDEPEALVPSDYTQGEYHLVGQ